MKKTRFLIFVLAIATVVLSACGGVAATPAPSVGGGKVEAIPVAFIGTVDSIAGDQWVISGTTATVDPAVVRDGPFSIGDQVKVEGVIEQDGSFTVSRVEVPSSQDLSTLPQFGDPDTNGVNANDNANVNDGNINDANINDGNVNDDNGNDANFNDDNSNAANANDANSNDDNSANSNDDNGGGNANDDNGNDDNSGGGGGNSGKGGGGDDDNGGDGDDDHGGNSNDD